MGQISCVLDGRLRLELALQVVGEGPPYFAFPMLRTRCGRRRYAVAPIYDVVRLEIESAVLQALPAEAVGMKSER